ncbi:hypothetical protein [Amycolatopsis minnesotensis]
MKKEDLIRMAANKAQESMSGGKMQGKTLITLVIVGVVVLLGFLAYRLILVELITKLSDHH